MCFSPSMKCVVAVARFRAKQPADHRNQHDKLFVTQPHGSVRRIFQPPEGRPAAHSGAGDGRCLHPGDILYRHPSHGGGAKRHHVRFPADRPVPVDALFPHGTAIDAFRPAPCTLSAGGIGRSRFRSGGLKYRYAQRKCEPVGDRLVFHARTFLPDGVFLLSPPLSDPFWQGVLMVCGDSLLRWISTRRQSDWPGLPENPATRHFPTSWQTSGSDGMPLQM